MKSPLNFVFNLVPVPRVQPYRLFTLLCPLLALASVVLSLFDYSLPWLLDLGVHWVWPSLVVLAALSLIGSKRERATSLIGVALCVLLLGTIPSTKTSLSTTVPLSVASVNVLSSNKDFESFNKWLADKSPDVVAALEVSPAWAENIRGLSAYPHQKVLEQTDNFGIALLSKFPFEVVAADNQASADSFPPSISAVIAVPGALPLKVVATHTLPPGSAEAHDLRAKQLAHFGKVVATYPGPAMLVGDLNATPWSGPVQHLRRIGLSHLSGAAPTWPATGLPVPMIQIDHALGNKFVEGVESKVGPSLGSDHRPLWIEVRVPSLQK